MKKFTDKINESLEDKIPTAEQIWFSNTGNNINQEEYSAIIEFAKLHVRAAVKEQIRIENDRTTEDQIDKLTDEALQRTYPLQNIK